MTTQNTAYRTLDAEGVRSYVASLPTIAARLGSAPETWTIREVSDGNLNMVFLAEGSNGGVCLKQALPHVRVDPSWKMPLDRTFFEAAYLRNVFPHVPDLTTECLHFDPEQFILIVKSLSGHTVLRTALMNGPVNPEIAARIGRFVAHSTFATSLLAAPFEPVMERRICFARNQTLTRITVDLVLTDPYHNHPRNHWAEPGLTPVVDAIRADENVLARIDSLRLRFLSCPQALLHGDLHTGSIMTTEDDTRVIDGEFAIYGPIGFDAGLFVANLVLSLFATPDTAATHLHKQMITLFWGSFTEHFLHLWNTQPTPSDPAALYYAPTQGGISEREKTLFLESIFQDMIGYCGAEIIRRIIGYAHVADFSVLPNTESQEARKKQALLFAKKCLDQKHLFKNISDFLTSLSAD
ncbi:methylthioribose kinase [Acetobacter senegalensis]|uniref:S-methyl-5-thioribose kinase n=2 Tax=Acetobacter TaxID=434 RepID=A0A252EIC9_9PROT|nr:MULTISPECIES: S-methyl-5-thioribose kinase [Acetobacter]ATJ90073.1 S-methyl-5-thioribose kinase [Acetobacter tropicalis]OUL65944.1 methylthioribose kinase [Acetobacter senegalensis]